MNDALGTSYKEWEIPRDADDAWPEEVRRIHADWWDQRIARQKEIDASIAAKADYEYLYDKPYEDNKKVRVAGPFTVESLSPHRLLGVDENDELIDNIAEAKLGYGEKQDFAAMILEHLKTSGVQQAHKEDRLSFSGITPWPGDLICAEGTYVEATRTPAPKKRAAIFIGPEFGTVSRPDLVQAVREAADADFDVLLTCAFNYEAHASEFNKLGRVPVLKARMNADLHMADDLKNTGKGNLFVIFGEPDIDILDTEDALASFRSRSTVWMFSTPIPAKSAATVPTASPAGSSTPTITRRASSSATPISWVPTIPTRPCKPPSKPRLTRKPGPRSTAIPRVPSPNRSLAGLQSR